MSDAALQETRLALADFSVHGTRFRIPLHTRDQRETRRLEKEKIAEAQGGKLAPARFAFARLSFTEAADRCLEERRPALARSGIRWEQER